MTQHNPSNSALLLRIGVTIAFVCFLLAGGVAAIWGEQAGETLFGLGLFVFVGFTTAAMWVER